MKLSELSINPNVEFYINSTTVSAVDIYSTEAAYVRFSSWATHAKAYEFLNTEIDLNELPNLTVTHSNPDLGVTTLELRILILVPVTAEYLLAYQLGLTHEEALKTVYLKGTI